jgi:hypothetical protein
MSLNLNGAAYGGNLTLGKAGLAAGTTSTYSVGATVTYAVGGRLFSLASAANQASPVTDVNTGVAFKPLAANQACLFVFMVNAAGQIAVAQGQVGDNAALLGGTGALQFPGVSDGYAPFGYLMAQAGASAVGSWTFGVNNLSSVTGLTFTFRDIMDIPPVPVTG